MKADLVILSHQIVLGVEILLVFGSLIWSIGIRTAVS